MSLLNPLQTTTSVHGNIDSSLAKYNSKEHFQEGALNFQQNIEEIFPRYYKFTRNTPSVQIHILKFIITSYPYEERYNFF